MKEALHRSARLHLDMLLMNMIFILKATYDSMGRISIKIYLRNESSTPYHLPVSTRANNFAIR